MPAEQIFRHPVNGNHWSIRSRIVTDNALPTLVLLHGFTGSNEDFNPLLRELDDRINWLAIDLPGHGQTALSHGIADCRLQTLLQGIESTLKLLPDPSKSFLLGYSMGARIALQYLVHNPQQNGILISGSPGLQTDEERVSRREADTAWIHKLNDPGYTIEDFCEEWEQQVVIRSQLDLPGTLSMEIAGRRRKNNKMALAAALQSLGTGVLPSLWSRLAGLSGDQLIVGEDDEKFMQIAEKMRQANPLFRLSAIAASGHAPHLEQPSATASAIMEHIDHKNLL